MKYQKINPLLLFNASTEKVDRTPTYPVSVLSLLKRGTLHHLF